MRLTALRGKVNAEPKVKEVSFELESGRVVVSIKRKMSRINRQRDTRDRDRQIRIQKKCGIRNSILKNRKLVPRNTPKCRPARNHV